jgi:Gpi18-like mannosyltransferase
VNGNPPAHTRLTPAPVLVLAAVMVVDHLATWVATSVITGTPLIAALSHYDSNWYNSIVNHGYTEKSWAFFPLYPALVRLIQFGTFGVIPPQITGAIFSTMLFAAFCVCTAKSVRTEKWSDELLSPKTAFGWFCFVYAPASYVLHSNHTESLFLLLSLAALFSAASGKWLWGGLFAGLCGLTRIQGYFVMTAVAFAALLAEGGAGRRARNFIIVCLVSGALAAIYPVYQFVKTGNALAFVTLQADWNHQTSTVAIYFKSLVLANPWQNYAPRSILHHGFAVALLASLWMMGRRSWPLSLYVALSLVVMPMEGEFMNAYRYGMALFPALYVLGDWVDARGIWLRAPIAAGLIFVNHWMAVNYIVSRWAY